MPLNVITDLWLPFLVALIVAIIPSCLQRYVRSRLIRSRENRDEVDVLMHTPDLCSAGDAGAPGVLDRLAGPLALTAALIAAHWQITGRPVWPPRSLTE